MATRNNCVAEFLAASITELSSYSDTDVRALELCIESKLAALLNRRVEGLRVLDTEALRVIPEILSEYDKCLEFKIIPFKTIPFALYESELERLLQAKTVVAAGVRSSVLFGWQTDEEHIVRVVAPAGRSVLLRDQDFAIGESLVSWATFERAVLGANSGFWVVYSVRDLKMKGDLKMNEDSKEIETTLGFSSYQTAAIATAIYPKGSFSYLALGLNGEAGEVAEIIKRQIRGGKSLSDEELDRLKAELGDCLWYIANFANELGVSLEEIAAMNILKLKDRQARGVLHGRGDSR